MGDDKTENVHASNHSSRDKQAACPSDAKANTSDGSMGRDRQATMPGIRDGSMVRLPKICIVPAVELGIAFARQSAPGQ